MLHARGGLLAFALVTAACAEEPRAVHVELALPDAIGCRPSAVDEVEVRALGDFPAREPNVLLLDPAAGLRTIDRFPDDTRVVAIEGRGVIGPERWIGGGVMAIDVAQSGPLLMLPYGRSCPLADASARVPSGAATVALPDGRLAIFGGDDGERVLDSIVSVRPGETLAAMLDVRLFVDRTGASASYVGDDRVVLAGGAGSIDGSAEDTFEIVRLTEGEEARTGDGFLAMRRRDHAALVLDGGRVLLVGGRSAAGGSALDDIELLEIEGDTGTSESVARLAIGRVAPRALRLDDGSVAIAGGLDASGDPVGRVERLDPATLSVESRSDEFPARAGAAYVALPGARVAQIGGRDDEGWSARVEVMLESGEVVAIDAPMPALEAPIAAPLVGGRVVVIGRDVADRRAHGVVLDVGSGSVVEIEASRVATALVPLADGSLAEGDAGGLSLLRAALETPFDAPPATIAPALMEDRARLAIDAPERWRVEGGALVATIDGARFDVPGLRFAGLELTLDANGALDVLFVREGDAPIALAIAQDAVTAEGCRVPRAEGAPLHLVRTGERVTIDAGAGAGECALELPERIGIAVRAHLGGSVRTLAIARR